MIYFLIAVFIFISVTLFYVAQHKFIFTPTFNRDNSSAKKCEILFLKSQDDIDLEGVVYEPQLVNSTVLFFGGRSHDVVGLMNKLIYNYPNVRIVTFNYRSFGRSGGLASEKKIFEDGLHIYDYITDKYQTSVYILGFSLGSCVASYVASKKDPLGVVLVGTFDSLLFLLRNKVRRKSVQKILGLKGVLRYQFNNYMNVQQISAPVYMFSSVDDEITYIQNARNLSMHVKNLALHEEYHNISHKDLLWHYKLVETLNKVFDGRL